MGDPLDNRFPSICECGEHAWRAITKGFVALCDPDDALALSGGLHARPNRNAVNVYVRDSSNRYIHRLIAQPADGVFVDHRNGNGLDNRRANLRLASHAENQRNRVKVAGKSSAFKGVSYCSRTKQWRARIKSGPVMLEGGYFTNERDAALAYDSLALRVHGEFAKTNRHLGLLSA